MSNDSNNDFSEYNIDLDDERNIEKAIEIYNNPEKALNYFY